MALLLLRRRQTEVRVVAELSRLSSQVLIIAFSFLVELDLLLRHQTLCKEWLQCGGSMRLPVKVNCLHSIARILDEPTALKRSQDAVPVENAGVWSLCQRLFDALGAECRREPTMTYLMDLLKQPFEELRIAVFSVLRAVAAQNNDWGVRALLSYGGFFEFLLDRNTEPTKETREWKFAILDAVLASPFQSRLGTSSKGSAARLRPDRTLTNSFLWSCLRSLSRCYNAGQAEGEHASRAVCGYWACQHAT